MIRAVGAVGAVLTTSRRAAGVATGSTYAASRALDPGGVTGLSISLVDERFPAWVNKAVPEVTAAASWILVVLLLTPLVRRLPLPRAIAASVFGVGLYLLDDAVTTKGLALVESTKDETAPAAAQGIEASD